MKLNENAPKFLEKNIHYLVKGGSQAYGLATPESDTDYYGWCIPPREYVFGDKEIKGFDDPKVFSQYIQKGDAEEGTIWNLTRFFFLCSQCNPNVLETLYVPAECVLRATKLGSWARDNRHIFLSRELIPRFKGYAFSQIVGLGNENYKSTSKRFPLIQKFGYDTKNAACALRLLDECEQLLKTGSMSLRNNSEYLRQVRAGEIPLREIKAEWDRREEAVNRAARETTLPEKPDHKLIRLNLMAILERCYG